MNAIKNIISIGILCLPLLFWMTSCKEKEEAEIEKPSQTFRPITFTRVETIEDQSVFGWVPMAGITYQFEISRDSMEFANDLKIIPLEGVSKITINKLWCGERYSVRVKAINKDTSIPESEYAYLSTPTFVMPTAGVFGSAPLVVKYVNQIAETVTLTWNAEKKYVDRISISRADIEVGSFPITEDEKIAGTKTIDTDLFLSSGALHYLRIYSGDAPIGRFSYTPTAGGIFNTIPSGSIGLNQVTLTWNPVKPVDRISVSVAGVEMTSVSLTAEEAEAGEKTITGLTSETAYSFQIFRGELCRGVLAATTLSNVSGVQLEDKVVFIGIGNTKILKANVLPALAGNKNITWSSDNNAVASIDPVTGEVTGIAVGNATITVTTEEGGYTAACTVRVPSATNLLLNGSFETGGGVSGVSAAENWLYIPWEWFESYYSNPGDKSRYSTTEVVRNTGDGTSTANPERIPFFQSVVTGLAALRLNTDRAGGVYQLVQVTPGQEYVFRADIGFRQQAENQNMTMESVKILSSDGSKLYAEALVPSFVYTIFDASGQPTPVPTYQHRGAVVEAAGTFTVPEGVTEVRFQLDQRTRLTGSSNLTPMTYIDNCELSELSAL